MNTFESSQFSHCNLGWMSTLPNGYCFGEPSFFEQIREADDRWWRSSKVGIRRNKFLNATVSFGNVSPCCLFLLFSYFPSCMHDQSILIHRYCSKICLGNVYSRKQLRS